MRARRRTWGSAGLAMTPMIDMTFLLLVFFMVTSKIAKAQKRMEIRLPLADAARVPGNAGDREILNLDAGGRIFAGDREVTMAGLQAYLKERLAAYPPLKVYVRADAATKAGQIRAIMEACAEAGAVEVIFGSRRS